MDKCDHAWTVTSECPRCLRAALDRALTEIRKQVFASRVVFDREIYEMAESTNPDNLPCVKCEEPTAHRKGERDDVPCCEDCHYCDDDPCDRHSPWAGNRPW